MYTGLNGYLKADGEKIAYISNWSVEETKDMLEVTSLGSDAVGKLAAKDKIPTLYSWSASASGAADFATGKGHRELREKMLSGGAVEVGFYLDGETVFLSGTAVIESMSLDISAEDKANISISLQGIGKLAYTAPAANA